MEFELGKVHEEVVREEVLLVGEQMMYDVGGDEGVISLMASWTCSAPSFLPLSYFRVVGLDVLGDLSGYIYRLRLVSPGCISYKISSHHHDKVSSTEYVNLEKTPYEGLLTTKVLPAIKMVEAEFNEHMVKKGINGFTNVDYKSKGLSNEALSRRYKCCPLVPKGKVKEGACVVLLQLATRIVVSNLHKNAKKSFSETIKDMYLHYNERSGLLLCGFQT
ncbi:unnamed protein product [Triticum turgidum subsp. durum]|uniref:Uncharacterized protein n=1 Tax=Triticum turgidum subsp. durum TaxID=4567 RepID=A0A9R0RG92_TRITD|nr:unnamed protein product [Triticum turgidum subsp. durum]